MNLEGPVGEIGKWLSKFKYPKLEERRFCAEDQVKSLFFDRNKTVN